MGGKNTSSLLLAPESWANSAASATTSKLMKVSLDVVECLLFGVSLLLLLMVESGSWVTLCASPFFVVGEMACSSS